ncbi:MAG TPA: hypothetical protein PKH77_20730 [Anaerolineae bacterium]|nr:hypothetical protein [Anaerolineae bacterium]
MNRIESRVLFGLLLILGGGIFLLNNLNVLSLDNVWPIITGIPALIFVYVFLRDRAGWWAAIPGGALAGITVMLLAYQLTHETPDYLTGLFLFGGVGLGFLAIYFRTAMREWWAIIPGGVTLTLATVTALDHFIEDSEIGGGVFMLGLGATFALVYLTPAPGAQTKWAAIPAAILSLIGLLSLLSSTRIVEFIWPVALILLGGYLLFKGARPRGSHEISRYNDYRKETER